VNCVYLLLQNRLASKNVNFLHAAKRFPHPIVNNMFDDSSLLLIIVMCVIYSLNKRAIDDSSKNIFIEKLISA
jgi:hypothetical protein